MTLPDTAKYVVGTYYFKVKVSAGTTHSFFPMTLEVRCHKKTNKITETTIFTGGLSIEQSVVPTNTTNFFLLPTYEFRSPECAQIAYIEVRPGSDQNASYLLLESTAVATDSVTWIVKPVN